MDPATDWTERQERGEENKKEHSGAVGSSELIPVHLQTDPVLTASLVHRLHIVIGLVPEAVGQLSCDQTSPVAPPDEEDCEKDQSCDEETELCSAQTT